MHTRICHIDLQQPDAALLAEAAVVIQADGLVAFPTETVYGLGANALRAEAIARIYAAKERPATDPIIAHIADLAMLTLLARQIPPVVSTLARVFWPGPLTLVLPRAATVPSTLSAGMPTVAVRMPAHPVAQALIEASGVPIAAPSANLFTRPSPTTARHVLEDLDGRLEMVLDAGPTTVGIESTVLDLTGEQPTVLRPGGIPVDALQTVLPDLVLAPRFISPEQAEAVASPGMLLKHYAPRAELHLLSGNTQDVRAQLRAAATRHLARQRKVGVLLPQEDLPLLADLNLVVADLGSEADLATVAARLFAGLRALDQAEVDVILCRDLGRDGLGLAIWDRLLRAARGQAEAAGPAGKAAVQDHGATK